MRGPLDKLEAELDAEVEVLARNRFGTYFEPRIDSKRQEVRAKREELESDERELESLKLEYAQTVQRYVERLRAEAPRNGTSQASTPEQSAIDHPRNGRGAQNGSRGVPTRRKMLLAVLPDFGSEEFIRRDVEAKIVKRWPEAAPKSDAEVNNFTSGLAGLLTDLVKKGRLKKTEGKTSFEAPTYRVVASDEDTLLEP